jgi:hypothetical protein
VLTPLQEQVASIIAGLAEAENFALAGGAALIARADDSTELDLGADDRLFPTEPAQPAPTVSGEELAVDKALAVFGRAEARDFVDLAAVEARYGLDRLFELAAQKDQGFIPEMFAEMAGRFSRLRSDEFGLDPEKGRLWPQLGKLRAACSFPYLLVEGTDIDRGPLHHKPVRGACLAVIDQGVALLRSGYQRDSALWIHRLAVRCQEVEPAADRPAYAQRPRPKPGDETAEAMLAAVPGVSTTSARALLERFGSVAGVVAADPAEWLSVPGIGPERARALEETFTLHRSATPTHDS